MSDTFGTALKDWRNRRNISQLEMALSADVSARHVSFLETGRAKPSRNMVLRLCDTLEIPRPARNQLLTSAGLAPAYAARDQDAPDLSPLTTAIDRMLEHHAPYPAFVLDKDWTLVKLNAPAAVLFAATGVTVGTYLLDALCDNLAMRDAIENLDEVIAYTIIRLRTESAHYGGNARLDAAITRLIEMCPAAADLFDGVFPAFIPARYLSPIGTLSFLSTIAQFGSVEDIAFADLKIEMMFPADDATKIALEQLAT
jgi:transcriptional regulator with XRE-family HTH domain